MRRMKLYLQIVSQVCFHCYMNIENPTFEDALSIFDTPSGIARALKIKPQAVYQWGRKLPPLRVYELSRHLKQLRDDGDTEAARRIASRLAQSPDQSAA